MTDFRDVSILLVEDAFLIALDAEQILRELGVGKVEIAATFEQAEQRIAEHRFDLVVLDLNLNGTLSMPSAERVRARGMIFASGYELKSRPLAQLDGGIVVGKPYSVERFRDALAAALGDGKAAV